MKRIVLALVCLMTIASTNAQNVQYYNTKHEVGITVGSGSVTQIFSGLADFMTIPISALVTSTISLGSYTGHYSYGDESYFPAITAEYYYHVNELIGLGGFLAFNGMSRDMYVEGTYNYSQDKTTHKIKTGEASRYNFSLIPTAKFDWLRKKNFGMYSKVGVGVSFMFEHQKDELDSNSSAKATDETDTTIIPNLQCSLLGLEGGSEAIRGFVELGFGEQGIMLAGVKYKF